MPSRSKAASGTVCSVEGCDKPYCARGLCKTHYNRWRRRGVIGGEALREKHGMSHSSLYVVWDHMKQRCNNPTNASFKNYGGRGITVCDEWNKSFSAFYSDMGDPPTDKHELDRRDNEGGYNKENCRWVLHVENNQNNRRTKLNKKDVYAIRQSRLSRKKLAKKYGVKLSTVSGILNRHTWRNVV